MEPYFTSPAQLGGGSSPEPVYLTPKFQGSFPSPCYLTLSCDRLWDTGTIFRHALARFTHHLPLVWDKPELGRPRALTKATW